MICPACNTPNQPGSEECFVCGKAVFALTQGSVLEAAVLTLDEASRRRPPTRRAGAPARRPRVFRALWRTRIFI